jgi:hypothetical protein
MDPGGHVPPLLELPEERLIGVSDVNLKRMGN